MVSCRDPVILTLCKCYATAGRCFDPCIRQLSSSCYRSLIQLTRCACQSDIAAQAAIFPGI
uniref:Uncharacterized protein n=1 Tax=Romanomermis culicivorax TaxID=13658 RepID=A0A915KX07_ROMCU